MIIPLQFEAAFAFINGFAVVTLNGKRGYVDKTGKLSFSPQYDKWGAFNRIKWEVKQSDVSKRFFPTSGKMGGFAGSRIASTM